MTAMSAFYMGGSHCSVILRWHTIPWMFNKSQIAIQVRDDLMVFCMQFEDLCQSWMPFLLNEKTVEETLKRLLEVFLSYKIRTTFANAVSMIYFIHLQEFFQYILPYQA